MRRAGVYSRRKNICTGLGNGGTKAPPYMKNALFLAISAEYIIMYMNVGIGAKKIHLCHPERNAVESKDLRTEHLHSSNDNA